MNTKMTQSSDKVRLRILEAAAQRFTQFGYNKTTMAEVAQDCGMSAANLYRYFENKLDIGANLACNCRTSYCRHWIIPTSSGQEVHA